MFLTAIILVLLFRNAASVARMWMPVSPTACYTLWHGTGPKANLRASVHDGQQDYPAAVAAVTEPATIFLLGLSSLVLFRGRRK